MFGKKKKIEIEISEFLLEGSRDFLSENNISLEEVINLFLYKSMEEEKLLVDSDFISDFYDNKIEKAKNFLFRELSLGRESFSEMEILEDDMLMFLGVC